MHYVYILFSEKDHLIYTGFTSDLKSRIEKHNNGFVKATKHRRPLKLIYYEAYSEELDARRREIYLKGGKGKSELKVQLKEIFSNIGYKVVGDL
ncbi:MAG: GIY-YIG nuclease family protein [Candidatus Levybacteria bacterium]|nr:GIY-YIG nuclease family protein [Candidatus Levybacteria bacterium]